MQINITARHLHLDDDFKVYINEKVEKLAKYANKIESAKVIFSTEKFNNITEITLTGRGFRLVAIERDQDIKVSFDICLTNIEKQLKRTRSKVKAHKMKRFFDGFKRLSELATFNKEFIAFRNAIDDKVNVLYKRKDGDYGLIEP